MGAHVLSELTGFQEGPGADAAAVTFVVVLLVCSEFDCSAERLVTHRTVRWELILLCRRRGFFAVGSGRALSGVDLLVLLQNLPCGEAVLADVALVRSLPGVGPEVDSQVSGSTEKTAADVAGAAQHPLVELLVLLQLLSTGEVLMTQEAAVRSFTLKTIV